MGDTRFDALTLVSGPSVEPISLAEAKEHLRVEHGDDDTIIARLISVAVATVDARGELGRAMVSQTWAQTGYGWRDRVELTMTPVQSLSAVKYFDTDNVEQTATLSDFRLIGTALNSYVEPVGSWPQTFDRPDALKLEYVAGWGDSASDVPESLRNALLMLVGHWYENREAYADRPPTAVPMGAMALIGLERASWYG